MLRLHGLPLAIVEQPVEILTRRVALRLSAEARAEAIEELTQASQQRARRSSGHARSVSNLHNLYKSYMRNGPINLTKQ